jgi:hypothetical protein
MSDKKNTGKKGFRTPSILFKFKYNTTHKLHYKSYLLLVNLLLLLILFLNLLFRRAEVYLV